MASAGSTTSSTTIQHPCAAGCQCWRRNSVPPSRGACRGSSAGSCRRSRGVDDDRCARSLEVWLEKHLFYRRQVDYHGPVLALWGDRDRLVPLAHHDGVMTAFPQAQVSVWEKMGHHPQRERPSELARLLQNGQA